MTVVEAEAKAMANKLLNLGMAVAKEVLFHPFHYVLHIDWDYPWPEHWLEHWRQHIKFMLEDKGFAIERIIIKPSPSREGGVHIWIHIASARQLSDDEINMLQWLSLDHHTRTWINTLRIDRGLKKFWNKLFNKHLWKKPLSKQCENCKIRQILYEMKGQRKPKRPKRRKKQ